MEPVKIGRGEARGSREGGFMVDILYPGKALGLRDSGIGAIGRVDRALVRPGVTIKMHPHQDDEILSYVRSGKMLHIDTMGNQEEVTPTRLMMMNAGHTFQHEERIIGPDDNEVLQIFLRPRAPDLEPLVQFHDFKEALSFDAWRLVAGPVGAPLIVRAQAWVEDAHLSIGKRLELPTAPGPGVVRILFAFFGDVRVGGYFVREGERLILDDAARTVEALTEADVVLISTDAEASAFDGGMFSGNILA